MHILLNGEEITGSPVRFRVIPAAPSSQKCYLKAPGEAFTINSTCEATRHAHTQNPQHPVQPVQSVHR